MKVLNFKNNPLCKIFKDNAFAWQLLQTEVNIELYPVADSSDISKLLALYMKGVETMNQIYDPRQSYFKNKAISLMGKSSVIKSFNQFQNSKKQKPVNDQVRVKTKQQNINQFKKVQSPSSKKRRRNKQIQQSHNIMNSPFNFNLLDRKKEIEVRVAYSVQQQSPQILNQLLKEHTEKQSKFVQQIQKILNNHQSNLNQRIKQRLHRQKRDISELKDADIAKFKLHKQQSSQSNKQEYIEFPIKQFNQFRNDQKREYPQKKQTPCTNQFRNRFNSPKIKQFVLDNGFFNQNDDLNRQIQNKDKQKSSPIKLKTVKSLTILRTRHKIFDLKSSNKAQIISRTQQSPRNRKMTIDIAEIKQYSKWFTQNKHINQIQ